MLQGSHPKPSSPVVTNDLPTSTINNAGEDHSGRNKLPSINSPIQTKSRDFLRTSKLGMGPAYKHPTPNLNQNNSNEQSTTNGTGLHLQFPSIMPRQNENKFPAPSLPIQTKTENQNNNNSTNSPKLLTPAQQQLLDQEHRKNVSSFKPQERDAVVFAELDHLQDLNNHEQTIIENYKNYLKNASNLSPTEKQPVAKKFHEDMKVLFLKKTRALGYVLEGHEIPLVFFLLFFLSV